MITEALAGPQTQIQARRASAERLLDYANHLDASDRALLRAVFDRGLTSTKSSVKSLVRCGDGCSDWSSGSGPPRSSS